MFVIKRGDTANPLKVTITDSTGAVVIATTDTVVFNMRHRGGSEMTVTAGQATDWSGNALDGSGAFGSAAGQVMYTFADADVDEAGEYDGEFKVTKAAGTIFKCPTKGFISIQIVEDLELEA